jgi:hypothetical protein
MRLNKINELAVKSDRLLDQRITRYSLATSKKQSVELLAKLPTEYGPRNVFASEGAVSGRLSRLSLPLWSIFPDAKHVDAVAVAAAVRF